MHAGDHKGSNTMHTDAPCAHTPPRRAPDAPSASPRMASKVDDSMVLVAALVLAPATRNVAASARRYVSRTPPSLACVRATPPDHQLSTHPHGPRATKRQRARGNWNTRPRPHRGSTRVPHQNATSGRKQTLRNKHAERKYVCVCVYESLCMCMCACEKKREREGRSMNLDAVVEFGVERIETRLQRDQVAQRRRRPPPHRLCTSPIPHNGMNVRMYVYV
jgi:hypothetical protein